MATYTSDYDYDLPAELIAQEPPTVRGSSRMMVIDRATGNFVHQQVADLPAWLREGDLLVLNDTKVFPARLTGQWADTGGAVEFLLLEQAGAAAEHWRVIIGSGRPVRAGLHAVFGDGELTAQILQRGEDGQADVAFQLSEPLAGLLERLGSTPLPPYIRRAPHADPHERLDRERYQTVYAREVGAVAAPTAGLHLTHAMLEDLRKQGVGCATVTLHVGPGTFKPVKVEDVEKHRMDSERYVVPSETAQAILACRSRGGRVVAVGSTTVRTLETVAALYDGAIVPFSGRSTLFIRPPYAFRTVDALLTNFHLPRSTLLMMVAAFAGRESVMRAYAAAIQERYRFFSYGDCMLLM